MSLYWNKRSKPLLTGRNKIFIDIAIRMRRHGYSFSSSDRTWGSAVVARRPRGDAFLLVVKRSYLSHCQLEPVCPFSSPEFVPALMGSMVLGWLDKRRDVQVFLKKCTVSGSDPCAYPCKKHRTHFPMWNRSDPNVAMNDGRVLQYLNKGTKNSTSWGSFKKRRKKKERKKRHWGCWFCSRKWLYCNNG